MYCENCGSAISEMARFCGNCGAAVSPPVVPVGPAAAGPAHVAPPPPPAARAVPPPPVSPRPVASPLPPPPHQPPSPAPAAADPLPPDWHWAVVLILSAFTYGLGGIVWAFRQAFFVKKIDPASKAVFNLGLGCAAMLVQVVFYFVAFATMGAEDGGLIVGVILLLNVAIVVPIYLAVFGMRKSLVGYYNAVEPYGLSLGGVMTFFFTILYLQYHLRRIAAWKKTGVRG